MIKGSHNTMSYLKPQWWARPFAYMARCQDKDIRQQYAEGVRCFDFRIRFNKNHRPYFCHGLAKYTAEGVHSTLLWLNEQKEGSCVRIVYEGSFTEKTKNMFEEFLNWIELNCKYLVIQAVVKKPWEIIQNDFNMDMIEVQTSPYDLQTVLMGPRKLLHLQEEKLSAITDYNGIILQDFV